MCSAAGLEATRSTVTPVIQAQRRRGDHTLNGGAGADNSIGGAGDDTHFIDSAGDILDEASGGSGIDTVVSSN